MKRRLERVGLSRMTGRLNPTLGAVAIMMLAGIIFLIVGVKALVHSQRFLANAAATTGMVVDIHSVVQDNEPAYYPIVEFTTSDERVAWLKLTKATQMRRSVIPSRFSITEQARMRHGWTPGSVDGAWSSSLSVSGLSSPASPQRTFGASTEDNGSRLVTLRCDGH